MGKSYKELVVWEKAMELAEETYKLVEKLPKQETYALSDQMRRAAISIPSNIAEGQRRNSTKEFKQFLSIADGSCAELETQILIAIRIGLLDSFQCENCLNLCTEVAKMITGLKSHLLTTNN